MAPNTTLEERYTADDAVYAIAYAVFYGFLAVASLVGCCCICCSNHCVVKIYAVTIICCLVALTVMDYWTIVAVISTCDDIGCTDPTRDYYVARQGLFWFTELYVFIFAAWDAWDQSMRWGHPDNTEVLF